MSDDFTDHATSDELVIGGPRSPRDSHRSRKSWWIGGGALAVLAIGGGAAAWAAASFFSQGSQPAEALPDSTLGYMSIDLDPSGGQKIAALKLARKFPAFKDKVGLQTGDDVRKWAFDKIAGESDCKVDFERDVAPWLGSRLALAAVGEDKPFPVVVVQTTDASKADAGLKKLTACDQASHYSWRAAGDWTVVAETQAQVDQVVDGAKKGSLADDSDFKTWTSKAGDSGIMTAYAAPAAGQAIAKEMQGSSGDLEGLTGSRSLSDPLGITAACPGLGGASSSSQRLQAQLADFGGAAATMRFGDGGLDLEMVGDTRAFSTTPAAPSGTPLVSTLPADTAVAFGMSLPKGWGDRVSDNIKKVCGDSADVEKLLAPLSEATGLSLPGDLEKVFGDSVALALGPGVDFEGLVNGGDPSDLPVALKVGGEKSTIDGVVTKLRASLGAPDGALEPVGEDGAVALGLDQDYAGQVAKAGGLGSSGAFKDVVPQGDKATAVLYVRFDGLDRAIKALSSGDEEVTANLAPLKALGLSSWKEGSDTHSLLKISVD